MRKRIAIITGASGGIGKEFTKLLVKEDVDEGHKKVFVEERGPCEKLHFIRMGQSV